MGKKEITRKRGDQILDEEDDAAVSEREKYNFYI